MQYAALRASSHQTNLGEQAREDLVHHGRDNHARLLGIRRLHPLNSSTFAPSSLEDREESTHASKVHVKSAILPPVQVDELLLHVDRRGLEVAVGSVKVVEVG